MPGERILVVEDDPAVSRALQIGLVGYGFTPMLVSTGEAGYEQAVSNPPPGVVLLDLGLPDVDGLEVLVRIRQSSMVPIIVLTARGAEHEKVTALEDGADDYVTKPFSLSELLARIRVALRHTAHQGVANPSHLLQVGALGIDLAAHEVTVNGLAVHLTRTEFKLLETLARNAGRLSTHGMLLREIRGVGYGAETPLLRVFIAQLRAKLEANPADPQYILTEPGVGYRFAPLDEDPGTT
ncbi:MAG: response regulator transcription factor [Chloroflexia bacterium]